MICPQHGLECPPSCPGRTPAPRYCLVSDDDGHDFVVPVERRDEFFRVVDAIQRFWASSDEDADCPTMPDEFHAVGGSLTFERPEIDGRRV